MPSHQLPISRPVDPLLLKPDRSPAPYLQVLAAEALLGGVWALVSAIKGSGTANYEAWVYRPEVHAWLVVLLLALIAMLVVLLPMPQRARACAVLLSLLTGLVIGFLGLHESVARRHLGHELDRAMASVRIVGATQAGPVLDDSHPLIDSEPVHLPGRGQTWRLPGTGQATACAAIRASAPANKGWTTKGDCVYSRHVGRVIVELEPTLGKGDNWLVGVSAFPSYF